MYPPAAIATRLRAERASGPGATKVAIAVSAAGITARSTAPPQSIVGSSVSPPRSRRAAIARVRPSESGEWTTSASVNSSHSPRERVTPCQQAHGLPTQSSGSGAPSITLTRGSSPAAARAAVRVPSSDWSSTTITSTRPYSRARRLRTAAPIPRSSSRAGTITLTSGPGVAGGSRSARGATRRSCTARAAAPPQRAAATPEVMRMSSRTPRG